MATKMKKYATFAEYVAAQSPRNRTVIQALRGLVERTAPALDESVKWGNGCWVKDAQPVAFVYSRPDYVEFGFFRGSALEDPSGLLDGKGAYVRHVKMRTAADTRRAAVARLLRQAARLTT